MSRRRIELDPTPDFVFTRKSQDSHTPNELAAILNVRPSTVRGWIRRGRLSATRVGRRLEIPSGQPFVIDVIRRGPRPASAPYAPEELREYSDWHETLDEFVWLLKTSYARPVTIKRKKFRLDDLFSAYVHDNRVNLPAIRRSLGGAPFSLPAIADDLKRGWYNELAYACPVKPATLGLSFNDIQDNLEASADRFAFPSWPIVTAYYAAYFFIRSIVLTKQPTIRLQEHAATLRAFKHNVVGAIDNTLLFFPFNVWHAPGRRVLRRRHFEQRFPHWRLQLSRHPRPPHPTPMECLAHVRGAFKQRARSRAESYGLLDWFHDFRVWVNYQDIDSMLQLWGGGFRAFLDMNVGAVLFFIAGMAELSFLAIHGGTEYLRQLQQLYERLTQNNAHLSEKFTATPVFQRLELYRHWGFVQEGLQLRPREDPHAVRLSTEVSMRRSHP